MFIIDLDNTLFNTYGSPDSFSDYRVKSLEDLGIDKKLYLEAYSQARLKDGFMVYNDEQHAKVLAKYGFDKKEILKRLKKSHQKSVLKDMLYDDALLFLDNIKKFNEPIYLLSWGNTEFQKLKIDNLDLAKYFGKIFFTGGSKIEITKNLMDKAKDEEIWFINDKIKETLEIHNALPSIKPVSKQSAVIDEQEYINSKLPYFSTLTEIYEYIKQSR